MLPKWHKILMFVLPFSNEIANALTISHTLKDTPFKRLYKPCDEDITKKIESSIIDAVALIGICWNVAYMGSKHGTKMGLLYGCIVLSLSFIIPLTKAICSDLSIIFLNTMTRHTPPNLLSRTDSETLLI